VLHPRSSGISQKGHQLYIGTGGAVAQALIKEMDELEAAGVGNRQTLAHFEAVH